MAGNGTENSVAKLNGRTALVTGAASSIGRAISVALARRGAKVALSFRNSKDKAEALACELRDLGAEPLAIQGDVVNPEEARRVVRTVVDRWQRLDILVNNAGITRDKSLRKGQDDEWADVININMNGTLHCTTAALPIMTEQRFGRIINVSSMMEQTNTLGRANQAADRGGMSEFTRSIALEMAKYNITANTVCPGFTCTELLSQVPETILEQIKAKIPLGRFGLPEEIAKAVVFLAADGDYITGQQLNVNGGMYV